jgi:hypothetical protein
MWLIGTYLGALAEPNTPFHAVPGASWWTECSASHPWENSSMSASWGWVRRGACAWWSLVLDCVTSKVLSILLMDLVLNSSCAKSSQSRNEYGVERESHPRLCPVLDLRFQRQVMFTPQLT